jgi:surface protein
VTGLAALAAAGAGPAGWDLLPTSCTTGVTNMNGLFNAAQTAGLATFNGDIGSWDTAAVTNVAEMFLGASAFNQDIGNWNTGAVTDMRRMFDDGGAAARMTFNQDLSKWNTGAVTNMYQMFFGVASFNNGETGNTGSKPLRWADTSKVTNMRSMFGGAAAFNQDISTWNTGAVTDMESMFDAAVAFNQDIGTWNTAAVTTMNSMFNGATAFNQVLTGCTGPTGAASCNLFAVGATTWLGAYNNAITNKTPPLSASMIAAGCGP